MWTPKSLLINKHVVCTHSNNFCHVVSTSVD